MTGRAVVPTLAAPAAENQPLGQFQGASSESRDSNGRAGELLRHVRQVLLRQ